MTQENPIEETPVPETDADKIARLEAELAAANEIVARQQDTIRSNAAQKSADDATIANQAATITDLRERVIPELNARHAQEIAGRDAIISEGAAKMRTIATTALGVDLLELANKGAAALTTLQGVLPK